MSKAIKMKTILKVLKNSSYFEHVLEYRGVPPNFTVSNSGNYKYVSKTQCMNLNK